MWLSSACQHPRPQWLFRAGRRCTLGEQGTVAVGPQLRPPGSTPYALGQRAGGRCMGAQQAGAPGGACSRGSHPFIHHSTWRGWDGTHHSGRMCCSPGPGTQPRKYLWRGRKEDRWESGQQPTSQASRMGPSQGKEFDSFTKWPTGRSSDIIQGGGGLVTKLCPTLCDPMDCSLPGSSVHGDSPGKNPLEWAAMPSSRGSSQIWCQTQVSHIAGRFFTIFSHRRSSVQNE